MADAVVLYGGLTGTISATNSIATLPAANMLHPHVSRVARFGTAATVIDLDLGFGNLIRKSMPTGAGDIGGWSSSVTAVEDVPPGLSGWSLQLQADSVELPTRPFDANGMRLRATGWVKPAGVDLDGVGIRLRKADGSIIPGTASPIVAIGATDWVQFDVEWTVSGEATDWTIGIVQGSSPPWLFYDLRVEDVTAGTAPVTTPTTARGVFLAGLTGAATVTLTAGTTAGASDVYAGAGLVTASTARNAYAVMPSAATARHWRIGVTGSTEIGRLLLGPALSVSRNIGYPLGVARKFRNRIVEGYGGERTIDRRPDVREVSFGWVNAGITSADVAAMEAFDAAVSGGQAAFIADPADASLGAPLAMLGWVDEIGDATLSGVGEWRKSYRIREAT